MVLNIISPEFSFLDFNYIEPDGCDAESLASLPVCNDLGIKAQIEIETDVDLSTDVPLYVAILDQDCNIIYDDDIEITPICSKYKFYTDFEGEEVPESNPYNLCYDGEFEVLFTEDFSENPFDLVTSDDLSFELTFVIQEFFQLYIEEKIYLFERSTDYPYSINTVGNINYVSFGGYGAFPDNQANFLQFLNEVIDANHGTTSTLSTDTFTIANIPAGSYLNNAYGFINTITTVTASTNIGEGFYYDGVKLVSYNTLPSYEFTVTTTEPYYLLSLDYVCQYSDFTGNVIIDDGISPITVPITFDLGAGTLLAGFMPTPGLNSIKIEIDDNAHGSGLTIDNIEVTETVKFNVTASEGGYGYEQVPLGTYYGTQLNDVISELLGIDFDCEFTSCCTVPFVQFTVTMDNEDVAFTYELMSYWQKGFIEFPELDLDEISEDCFTYGILDYEKNLIACSNLFHKETDCCYVTKIEYSNNEDAFGFSYPDGVTNTINFPFFLFSPKYPTTEKIYRQTNGIYKRLSADIEKEYECETDYIHEGLHDKLITALKHDTLIVTSNRLGFTDQMCQQGDYSPNWNSKIDFTSKAEFKLRKYFNGKNNNCGENC